MDMEIILETPLNWCKCTRRRCSSYVFWLNLLSRELWNSVAIWARWTTWAIEWWLWISVERFSWRAVFLLPWFKLFTFDYAITYSSILALSRVRMESSMEVRPLVSWSTPRTVCIYHSRWSVDHHIYHCGDTAVFSDMKVIDDLYIPDVCLLCIGDHYTMGPREAAYALDNVLFSFASHG